MYKKNNAKKEKDRRKRQKALINPTFTCSKSTIETKKMEDAFEVNTKNTRTMSNWLFFLLSLNIFHTFL